MRICCENSEELRHRIPESFYVYSGNQKREIYRVCRSCGFGRLASSMLGKSSSSLSFNDRPLQHKKLITSSIIISELEQIPGLSLDIPSSISSPKQETSPLPAAAGGRATPDGAVAAR